MKNGFYDYTEEELNAIGHEVDILTNEIASSISPDDAMAKSFQSFLLSLKQKGYSYSFTSDL